MGGKYGLLRSCSTGSYGAKKPAKPTIPWSTPRVTSHLVRTRRTLIVRCSQPGFGDQPNRGACRQTDFLRPGKMSRTACLRRSEEHTSELQSHHDLVCRLLLE